MKEEYVLYLDESEFKNSKTFAIAGIAVKNDQIPVLEQGLNEIKKLIWSEDYINNNDPVMHCTELQNIYNKRNNMEQVDQRSFWGMKVLPSFLRMEELIKTNKKLKNAYENLKKERNRQNKKIEKYENKINQLETEVKQLKTDLEDLRKNKKSIDIDSNN